MPSKFFIMLLISLSLAVAQMPTSVYGGIGWRNSQLGTTTTGVPVNGDQVTLNIGWYNPNYALKLEASAAVLGYLDFKRYENGVAVENYTGINSADYLINATCGFTQKRGDLSGHPLLLLGAGAKRVWDNQADVTIPFVQFGVGFIIFPGPIEFYGQYYYNYLLHTPVIEAQIATIRTQALNGVLEVGFNYHF